MLRLLLLALPLELLKSRPNEFSQLFFGFLGLPKQPLETSKKTNKGWGPITVELYRATNGFLRANPLSPHNSAGYNVRQFIAWRLDRALPNAWNKRLEEKRREVLKSRIGDMFKDSNDTLGAMLNIDLASMGYL